MIEVRVREGGYSDRSTEAETVFLFSTNYSLLQHEMYLNL